MTKPTWKEIDELQASYDAMRREAATWKETTHSAEAREKHWREQADALRAELAALREEVKRLQDPEALGGGWPTARKWERDLATARALLARWVEIPVMSTKHGTLKSDTEVALAPRRDEASRATCVLVHPHDGECVHIRPARAEAPLTCCETHQHTHMHGCTDCQECRPRAEARRFWHVCGPECEPARAEAPRREENYGHGASGADVGGRSDSGDDDSRLSRGHRPSDSPVARAEARGAPESFQRETSQRAHITRFYTDPDYRKQCEAEGERGDGAAPTEPAPEDK